MLRPAHVSNHIQRGDRTRCFIVATWEQDLIRQVQEGNLGAFAPLVRKYERPLRHAVYNILGDVDAAEEVTQEAFITTFERIHLFNPDHRYFSWVYRIAVNGALNKAAQRKARRPFCEYDIPCPGPSPHARLETREQSKKIHQAMATLVFKYRVIIILRHFLDFSYEEISFITDQPVSTVRSRLHTARALMKEELGQAS